MKLLFITGFLPHPPRTGGTIIAYNFLKHLSAHHTVDLIAFADEENPNLGDLATYCRSILWRQRPAMHQMKTRALLGKLFGVPGEISKYYSTEMQLLIQQTLTQEQYDAVLYQGVSMAQYKPATTHGASILLVEDPPALKFRRASKGAANAILSLRARYESALLKRVESRITKRFDRMVMLNESDRRDYEQEMGASGNIRIVPYGVDVHAFEPGQGNRDFTEIVMTGNMFHPPNVEAVLLFANHIFPIVQRQVPAARLTLVGAKPAEAIVQLARDNAAVVVTGTVPDVRPYLQRAAVSVSPIQLKIGTQTKVLEAMACGTPVVTTSAGNNGVGATDGKHLYVADAVEDFAERVVSLLRGKHWNELSSAGREFVVQNFAWESVANKLSEVLAEVTTRQA